MNKVYQCILTIILCLGLSQVSASSASTYQKEIDYLDKAISINPDNADMYYGRGLIKFKLAEIEDRAKKISLLKEVISDFDKVLKIDPQHKLAIEDKKLVQKWLNSLTKK